MKQAIFTDPFTGIEFGATEYADGSFVATNPITGEQFKVTYNPSCKRYQLPKQALKHIEVMSMKEAAEYSGVSVQAISNAVDRGKLQARKLANGHSVIVKRELDAYNSIKKVGRPAKDATC